jgi:mannose-6-phosphate isomerase-like protein (cupin superfamily)
MTKHNVMAAYQVGDRDSRPWGEYEVTAVGTNDNAEFCEKCIIVQPNNILSLQSHDLRRETWGVLDGELTVILNDRLVTLRPGEEIFIPQSSIHAMANLSDRPCKVFERQEGICREEDIKRYLDAYGRDVAESEDPNVRASLANYRKVLDIIQERTQKKATA